ncbi:hypothetical protein [Rathayibacter sp. VKM Ac-2857]|nr:hypothetical protein [Rathayibacter sp. VKM Ac-2857]
MQPAEDTGGADDGADDGADAVGLAGADVSGAADGEGAVEACVS